MNAIQRLNYFTSQFLVETDFQDEQSYHRNMRLRHNQSLHSPGVVGDGLQVSKASNNQIVVSEGMAIDKDGQEIVLLTSSDPVTLSGNATDVFVTIQYAEVPDVPDTTSGLTGKFRRTTEKFQITSSTTKPPIDGFVIQLARVTLDANGNITQINNSERILAGAVVSPKSIGTEHLVDGSVTAAKLSNASVGNSTIADNAITAVKIADGAVGTAKLATGTVTADKIAQSAFVVRTRSFSQLPNLPSNPVNVAEIKITVPSQGAVILTASGSYNSIPTPVPPTSTPPDRTFFRFQFGLQEGNVVSTMPDDSIVIFNSVPNSRISGPFSITKAFPVSSSGVKTYSLVGIFTSSFDAPGSLFRLTLTAMFIPCSGILTE